MRYLLLIVAAGFIFNSCSKQPAEKSSAALDSKTTSENNYKKNVSFVVNVNSSSGETASDFSWYDSNGKQISLGDLRGKMF